MKTYVCVISHQEYLGNNTYCFIFANISDSFQDSFWCAFLFEGCWLNQLSYNCSVVLLSIGFTMFHVLVLCHFVWPVRRSDVRIAFYNNLSYHIFDIYTSCFLVTLTK